MIESYTVIVHVLYSLKCRKKLSGMSNVAISLNMAYGDVNTMAEGQKKEDYENPGMILKPPDGRSLAVNETRVDDIIYETISCASQPAAEMPENSDTNDTEYATVSS